MERIHDNTHRPPIPKITIDALAEAMLRLQAWQRRAAELREQRKYQRPHWTQKREAA